MATTPPDQQEKCRKLVRNYIGNGIVTHQFKKSYRVMVCDVDATIKFLLVALKTSRCQTSGESINCISCEEQGNIKQSGSFELPNKINICQEICESPTILRDTIVHELIHAFDSCRSDFDYSDCRQRLCAEIRAVSLSGECNWSREIMRGHWKIPKGKQVELVILVLGINSLIVGMRKTTSIDDNSSSRCL